MKRGAVLAVTAALLLLSCGRSALVGGEVSPAAGYPSSPTATVQTDCCSAVGNEASPAPTVEAGGSVRTGPRKHFPVGVYEDAALLEGDVERFTAMVEDLRSRGFHSVLLTNGHMDRDEGLLAAADRLAF
ncbi:MAG: hypothetical protein M0Z94_06345, partial [Dehalococcoidales bacterium]|nr:hypothetical protein [Dehalococcoidales bacterium]